MMKMMDMKISKKVVNNMSKTKEKIVMKVAKLHATPMLQDLVSVPP